MAAPVRYPLLLDLRGRKVVVVGGGGVAARKVERLRASGAEVRVVAPVFDATLHAVSEGVELVPSAFVPAHLDGAFLVFACTNDRSVNAAVADESARRGIAVNVTDDPEGSDFHVPASLHFGDISVAISTGGASPLVAGLLRKAIEESIGDEFVKLTRILAELRGAARAALPKEEDRRSLYEEVATAETLSHLRNARSRELLAHLDAVCERHGVQLPAEIRARLDANG